MAGWRRILVLVAALAALLPGCSGEPPQNIGVREGRLAPCPGSPNCVSSFAADEEHGVAALKLGPMESDQAMDKVEEAVLSLSGARVVKRVGPYLRAEFVSRVFRFVDDVEFLYKPEEGLLHVRSASRLGYSDLGVNRKRVERLRELLAQP